MTFRRPIAWGLSLLGTLSQLAVLAAAEPNWFRLLPCIDCHWAPPTVVVGGWSPFIENLGEGDRPAERSRCPGPQRPGTPFQLDRAPLPAEFRPFDYSDTVLACVRLDSAGSIRSVRLISGTGKARLDRALVRAIVRKWRFEPREGIEARPGWQRIRLSSRIPEAPVTLK
jgi:TonB family protein